jgi:hypothetical protein
MSRCAPFTHASGESTEHAEHYGTLQANRTVLLRRGHCIPPPLRRHSMIRRDTLPPPSPRFPRARASDVVCYPPHFSIRLRDIYSRLSVAASVDKDMTYAAAAPPSPHVFRQQVNEGDITRSNIASAAAQGKGIQQTPAGIRCARLQQMRAGTYKGSAKRVNAAGTVRPKRSVQPIRYVAKKRYSSPSSLSMGGNNG